MFPTPTKLEPRRRITELTSADPGTTRGPQKIYSSKTERQALLDQVSRAFAAGIASTPTFIVNGQIMGFGPDGAFTIDAIKSAVGAATPVATKKSGK